MRRPRQYEQLAFMFSDRGYDSELDDTQSILRGRHKRPFPKRDYRGQFTTSGCSTLKSHHLRRLPARDCRGRFVSHPTTDAPSWYVLCVGGCRISGELEMPPVPRAAAPSRLAARSQSTTHARPWLTRSVLHNSVMMLLLFLVLAWYRLHLAPLHRLS